MSDEPKNSHRTGKNKSLNHQKPGVPKGLPIFALAGLLCGVG